MVAPIYNVGNDLTKSIIDLDKIYGSPYTKVFNINYGVGKQIFHALDGQDPTEYFKYLREDGSFILREDDCHLLREQLIDDPVPDYTFILKGDGRDTGITKNGNVVHRGWGGRMAQPDGIGFWLDGSSNIDNTDTSIAAFGTGAYTFSCRVSAINQGNAVIFTTGNADTSGIQLRINGTGFLRVRTAGSIITSSGKVNNGGEGHHIVFRSTGANGVFNFFIDGVKEPDQVSQNYNIADQGDARFGENVGGGTVFKGGLDDFRIYNRALTDEECAALNDYERGGDTTQITTALDLSSIHRDTIVPGTNGSVEQWATRGVNGNTLIQNSGALQGTLDDDIIEFVNGQRFDQTSGLVDLLAANGEFMCNIVTEFIDATASTSGFPIILDLQDDGSGGAGINRRRPGHFYSGTSGNFFTHMSGAGFSFNPVTLGILGYGSATSYLDSSTNTGTVEANGGLTTTSQTVTPRSDTGLSLFRLGDVSIQNIPIKIKKVTLVSGEYDLDKLRFIQGVDAWMHIDVPDPLAGHPALPVDHPWKYSPPPKFEEAFDASVFPMTLPATLA